MSAKYQGGLLKGSPVSPAYGILLAVIDFIAERGEISGQVRFGGGRRQFHEGLTVQLGERGGQAGFLFGQDFFPEFDLKSTHYSLVKAFKAWISL